MRIAVDYDGTLALTHKVVLDLLNFKHGTKFTMDDYQSWHFVKEHFGTDDDFWAIYDLFDTTYLRRAIPPVSPYAPAAVKWLSKKGHTVEVVTANHEESLPSIRSWLFGHGLGEFNVRSIGRKVHKQDLDYDLFIDDAPQLVHDIAAHPTKTLLLVTMGWNLGLPLPPNVVRMKDWKDAQVIFEEVLGL